MLLTKLRGISEGKLQARSLRDPEVAGWRQQALGDNLSWEPTLIKVTEEGVAAWTGRALTWQMLRLLGFRNAIRVAQLLTAPTENMHSVPNPGRRRAVRRMAGAAALLALGPTRKDALANQTGWQTWRGFQQTDEDTIGWKKLFDTTPPKRTVAIEGSAADNIQEAIGNSPPVTNALAQAQVATDHRHEIQPGSAARHVFKDGNVLFATYWTLGETHVVVAYQFEQPKKFETVAFVYELVDEDTAKLIARVSDHTLASQGRDLQGVGGPGPGDPDPCDCWACNCCCQHCEYVGITCIIQSCGTCAWGCRVSPLGCLGCALIFCSLAVYTCCEGGWDCVPC